MVLVAVVLVGAVPGVLVVSRVISRYAAALGEDLQTALRYAWLVIPALLALWLPGRVLLLALEKPGKELSFDWGERSALALALSAA